LWHKIFGSPAEQTAKLSEPAPGEPAWNEIRAEETSVVSESMEVIAEEDRAGGEFADMSDRGERTGFAEDEVPSEERKRGRRRRRRGGRGRRSGERHSDRSAVPLQQESEGIDDLGVELEDDESESDESLSFAGGVEGASSDLDVDDANGDAAENGIRTKSAAAKAIPSWDEAIGFIVDSNMQSRSQRRPPSRSGNGHRGRPRGRRKN
jgi:ribonuclease E